MSPADAPPAGPESGEPSPGGEHVVLYAEFTAKAGQAEQVESLLSGFAGTVRAEPGNVVFDIHRREEAPDRFFIYEVYRDRAAFEQHLAADSGRSFNGLLNELIVEAGSELSFLKPVGR